MSASGKVEIDGLIGGLLVVLAPAFLFPSRGRLWILAVFPALFIARGVVYRRMVERTPFDWPIFLFLFQVLLTCFIVPDIDKSLSKVVGALYGVIVFYALTALLKTRQRLKNGILAFVGGGTLFSIAGFLGMLTFTGKNMPILASLKDALPHIDFRLPGAEDGFQPNAVGGSLLFFVPLIVVALLNSALKRPDDYGLDLIHRKNAVYLYAAFSFVAISVLVLTQSRGSWAGFLVALGLIVVPYVSEGGPRRAAQVVYILVIAAAVVGGYFTLSRTFRLPLPTTELSDKFTGRTVLWSLGLEKIGESPWTGIGLNQVRYDPAIGYKTAHLHNHYIHTAAEMGVPGLFALLSILFGAGILCFRTWTRTPSRRMGWASLGLTAGLAGNAVFGITDSIPVGSKTSFFFWVSLALINGLYAWSRKTERVRV